MAETGNRFDEFPTLIHSPNYSRDTHHTKGVRCTSYRKCGQMLKSLYLLVRIARNSADVLIRLKAQGNIGLALFLQVSEPNIKENDNKLLSSTQNLTYYKCNSPELIGEQFISILAIRITNFGPLRELDFSLGPVCHKLRHIGIKNRFAKNHFIMKSCDC